MSGKTDSDSSEPPPSQGGEDSSLASRDEILSAAMESYQSPLIGYAAGIVHDVERARDVVQDTFVKLYQQEPGKILPVAIKSWLYTVCRNRALDVLRKEKRMVSLETEEMPEMKSHEPDPSQASEKREAHQEAVHCLDRLPENQREVIRLKFQCGLSYKEISAITELSVSNVGFLIHTGLKRLRKILPPRQSLSTSPPRYPNSSFTERSSELS